LKRRKAFTFHWYYKWDADKSSVLLTSNRPPSEWPGLFGDPLLASAGIDRICHRAEILVIRGDSFRAQGRQLLAEEVEPEQVT
jgi:hypothetical protein